MTEKVWDIYMEGFLVTGMEGIPTCSEHLGSAKGKSFRGACDKFFKHHKYSNLYNPENSLFGVVDFMITLLMLVSYLDRN